MSLKEKWLSKKEFRKETFEYLGEEVTIRELSGLEKTEMNDMDDMLEKYYFVWRNCVLTESIAMDKQEFSHAFDKCHSDIDHIVAKVLELSGKPEKN